MKRLLIILVISFILSHGLISQAHARSKTAFGVFGGTTNPDDRLSEKYDEKSYLGLKYGASLVGGGFEVSYLRAGFDRTGKKGDKYDLTIDCLNVGFHSGAPVNRYIIPFVSLGVGYYMPDSGKDRPGLDAGAGLIFIIYDSEIDDSYFTTTLDLSGVYHDISGDDLDFYELRSGITFHFD
ncbi:hypothetical protein ACFL2A_06705 [Thermodesulfobacteriota bacterium]